MVKLILEIPIPRKKNSYLGAIKKQEVLFSSLKLNRDDGLNSLNQVLIDLGSNEYTESNGMWSEHLVLFAAIADSDYKVRKILEIGTFCGQTTVILSKLFPSAKLTTYDLPIKNIHDKKIYEYAFSRKAKDEINFLELRNTNLSQIVDLEFKERNSLSLTIENGDFDLIWVDGAHGYPTVCADIVNSLRLLNENGLMICDDVYFRTSKNDSEYTSTASYETLLALKEAGLAQVSFVQKRLGLQFNFPKNKKKFLGVCKKL